MYVCVCVGGGGGGGWRGRVILQCKSLYIISDLQIPLIYFFQFRINPFEPNELSSPYQ